MKVSVSSGALFIGLGRLRFAIGWFSGEFPKLLQVSLCEPIGDYFGIVFIQVIKFSISLYVVSS